MISEAIIVALLAAFFIGFKDGKLDINKTAGYYFSAGFITFLVMIVVAYLFQPAFVGIWNGYYRIAVFPIIIVSLLYLLISGENSEGKEITIQAFKIVVVIVVGLYLAFTGPLYADQLYKIPEVQVFKNISEPNGIIDPINPEHVRLIDQKMASYLGNKIIGQYGNIGSQYEVLEEDFHIQKVNDRLWWVAPLEFRGYGIWTNVRTSPGFVMVDAEDAYVEPKLVLNHQMRYLPSAYFGDNIERYAYSLGYEHTRLEDYTFEITDNLEPRITVSITHPTILNDGDITDGVLVINPETGEYKEYPIGSVPDWIDRVVPERIAKNYVSWLGEYVHGWWNANGWFVSQKDVNEPTTVTVKGKQSGTEKIELFLVYGSNKDPYWFVGMTSSSESDQSLTSIILTDVRTGKLYQYMMSGANEQAVLDAVDSDVSLYKTWFGAAPIPYNVYGRLTYIVPIFAETDRGNLFKEVAFVDSMTSHVVRSDTKAKAAEMYKAYLVNKGLEVALTQSSAEKTVAGIVLRISDVIADGTSSFRMWLDNSDIIFAVDPLVFHEVAVTVAGDKVNISYDDTGDDVVAVNKFEDLNISARVSKEKLVMQQDIGNRTNRTAVWDEKKQLEERLNKIKQEQ